MIEKEMQVSVQKFLKILWATLSLLVLIISLWIIFDCFRKTPDQQKLIMNYNSNTNLDYKVYLKPNKFYERSFMEKNKKYISSIIDYIDVDLNYMFNTTALSDTTYSYSVSAVISSDYDLNGVAAELWSKSYQLVAPKSLTKTSSSGFQIKENLKLDYNKYDSLATSFKEQYGIASDTKLTILINIRSNTTIKDYSKSVPATKTISLVMPLNKAVTDITVTGVEPVSTNVTETIKGGRHINYVLLVSSVIAMLVSAPICFISFYKLFKITNVSQYIVEQKRILKGYGDVIAEVTTKPDLSGLKIIEVKDFEDLVNIEEELRVPILFYELIHESESWFIITTSTQAYRYVLKSHADLEEIYNKGNKTKENI